MAYFLNLFTRSHTQPVSSQDSQPYPDQSHSASSTSRAPSNSTVSQELRPASTYQYTCSLCWQTFEPPCYSIGHESRTACLWCWKWLFDVSICWSCGDIVYRKTDAVSFGWCWWHWSCLSCLVCKVIPFPRGMDRTLTDWT